MTQTVLFILGIIVIAILLTQKGRARLRSGLRRGEAGVKGICAAALGQDAKKRENKEKILVLFAGAKEKSLPIRGLPLEKGELNNEDIRNALGLSRRSVTRYMTELEREGRVEQVGDIGRGVIYRLR